MRYGGSGEGAYGGVGQIATIVGGSITGITDLAVADGGTGASTARAAAANLKVPYVLAQWGVPCILASSGTMGDNGAVSGMTALPATYDGGAWLYLPANAISASSAAGFYWFVASSTTAGTVYNSTWDGSGIPAAGTTTAFATIGPGAFTGIAAGDIACATITIPAGAMGPNGMVRFELQPGNNTAAGNKVFKIFLDGTGGTVMFNVTLSTVGGTGGFGTIQNLGAANRQRGGGALFTANGVVGAVAAYASIDTATAKTVVLTLQKATAGNHAIWDGGVVTLVNGP